MVSTQFQLLNIEQVSHATQRSTASIYRDIRKGEFPAAIRIGRNSVRWRSDDIEDWLNSRPRNNEPYCAGGITNG